MPTETHVKDGGGTWRKAKEVHYKSGGTWYKAKEVWYKSGGTWRKVFSGANVVAAISNAYVYGNGTSGTVTAYFRANTDGTHTVYAFPDAGSGGPALWYDPQTTNIGNSYYVRFTLMSGAAWNYSGSVTSGTWNILSSNRVIGYSQATIGTRNGSAKEEISADQSTVLGVNSSTWHYIEATRE